MDKVEVLCDAYKEAYTQSRKVHRATLLIGLFSLLVILLVIRDSVIIDTAGPKIDAFKQRLETVEEQLAGKDTDKFTAPRSYYEARAAYNAAKLKVDNWHNNLPARKKMQERYRSLLTEYSGSHDKVIERLRIDGEPGLKLYTDLKTQMQAMEAAENKLAQEDKKRKQLLQAHTRDKQSHVQQLEKEKARLNQDIQVLTTELERLQRDQARVPWLGLRINPKDLLTLIPILLLVFFHILFDKFDELLSILRKPELKEYQDALMVYPAPVFFSKRSVFSIFTLIILYGLIPLVQITSVVMIFSHRIPLIGFGPGSWNIAAGIGVLSCIITLWYPIMLFRKHKGIMLSKVR